MKFGIRKPSFKKSLAARTSLKKLIMPRMPRGYGFLRNPKKALYNKVYNRTSVSAFKLIKSGSKGCASVFIFGIIMLLICLFTAFSASAQMEKTFSSRDSSDITKLVNTVLASTKNQYHLDTLDVRRVTPKYESISVKYSDGTHWLRIDFTGIKSGGNFDLGTPDTLNFTFVELTGFFQDIFPFWKKYYQPDADMVTVVNDGRGKVIVVSYLKGTMVSAFNKDGDLWSIDNHYNPNFE